MRRADDSASAPATTIRQPAIVGRHRFLPYQPGLDGIRGISILAVVVFHTSTYLPGGFAALSLFFTLSGYLITTLLLAELRQTGTVDLGRFWIRRLQRLAPAGLFVVAVVLGLSSTGLTTWGAGVEPVDAGGAIWSFSNWVMAGMPDDQALRALGPLSAYWSLAVEEQFYVGIAVVFLVVRRLSRPLYWIAVVLGAAFVLSSAVVALFDWSPSREEFGTDMRIAEIAAGCLLAVGIARRPALIGDGAHWWNPLGWLALAGTCLFFVHGSRTTTGIGDGGFVLIALGTNAMILAALAGGSLNRLLAWAPLSYVGRISYAVYVIHWPIRLVGTPDRLHLDGFWLAAALVVLSLAAGALVHHVVERPLRARPMTIETLATTWFAVSVTLTLWAIAIYGA